MEIVGCAATISVPPLQPRQTTVPGAEEQVKTPEEPSPRLLASLQMTEQGRMLLQNGRPDDAISVLERAVILNPANGQNYYYLSEAWLIKGNSVQAEEFNRLAGIYLEGDTKWMARIMEQRERIKIKYK